MAFRHEIIGTIEDISELEKHICNRSSSLIRLRATDPSVRVPSSIGEQVFIGQVVDLHFPRTFSHIEKDALRSMQARYNYEYDPINDDGGVLRQYRFTLQIINGAASGQLYDEKCSETIPYWLV